MQPFNNSLINMLDAVASTFGSILTFQIFCYTFAIYQDE